MLYYNNFKKTTKKSKKLQIFHKKMHFLIKNGIILAKLNIRLRIKKKALSKRKGFFSSFIKTTALHALLSSDQGKDVYAEARLLMIVAQMTAEISYQHGQAYVHHYA